MAMAKTGGRTGGMGLSFKEYIAQNFPELVRPAGKATPTRYAYPMSRAAMATNPTPSPMPSPNPTPSPSSTPAAVTLPNGQSLASVLAAMQQGSPYRYYPFSNGTGRDLGDYADRSEGRLSPGEALLTEIFGGGSERGIGHPARRRGK